MNPDGKTTATNHKMTHLSTSTVPQRLWPTNKNPSRKNNTGTSEVSDNTMLSAASLSEEHDATWMLFDESELLGMSSQKESQDESDEMTNSDQKSTLEAEDKTASPLAKTNTSPEGAKETSPEKAKETPTSPKGAINRTIQTKVKETRKDQAKNRKTDSATAPTDRVTRNKPRLDYGSIHKGKNETPSTERPTTSRDQQDTLDQQVRCKWTKHVSSKWNWKKLRLNWIEPKRTIMRNKTKLTTN